MDVIEYAEKYLKKEYEELKILLVLHNTGTKKSKKTLDRIRKLIIEISLKYQISKFADYKELSFKTTKPKSKIEKIREKFERDTKYGCGLWIGTLVDKVNDLK